MREDTVRLWRGRFRPSGVDALSAHRPRTGISVKGTVALQWYLEPWPTEKTGRSHDRIADRSARGRRINRSQLSKRCSSSVGGSWHTLKGRQSASEVDRIGLRLQLRKRQAEAGDIVLLYGDESEALTHPYLARAWAKSGADLRVPAPGQAKKVAMLGSLDHVTRQLIVHASPTKRSTDFVAHLEQLDRLYGPMPGRRIKPVVLVEDNGPIHVSKLFRGAKASPPGHTAKSSFMLTGNNQRAE